MKPIKYRVFENGVMKYDIKNPFDYIERGIPIMEYTGIPDMNDDEIYDDDFVKDEVNIYRVEWNQQNTSWKLSPIKSLVNEDYILMVLDYHTVGDGYLKRRDLVKVGNVHENPEYLNDTIN